MRKKPFKYFLTALLMAAVFAPAGAQETSSAGVIKGVVVNGTDGSVIYAGQEVKLMMFAKGGNLVQKVVKTDDKGDFIFTDLPIDPNLIYMVTANYHDVLYHAGRISLKDSNEVEAKLTVYETTESDENISIESEHIIVERAEGGGITFIEIVSMVNTGNQTYVSHTSDDKKKAFTLSFPLPQGYTRLKLMDMISPQFIKQEDDGFSIARSLLPGKSQISFTYQLPATLLPLKWNRRVIYPTAKINLLYGDPNARIDSKELTDMGLMEFGNQKYLLLQGDGFPRGSSLTITIGGETRTMDWVRYNQGLLVIIFMVALGAVLGVFMVLRKTKPPAEEVRAYSTSDIEEQRSELIEYIAGLDDRFKAGELSRREYEKDRQEKKAHLVQIVRMIEHGKEEPRG